MKPLATVVEALRRPDFFNPVTRLRNEKEPRALLEELPFSANMAYRGLATALGARAMLRVGEGKSAEAWQDLLACHKLGRTVSRSVNFIDVLTGISIEKIASDADLAYIEHAKLTSREILESWEQLQKLPPLPPLAEVVEVGERCLHLDVLQTVRRHGLGTLERLSELSKFPPPVKKAEKPAIKNISL